MHSLALSYAGAGFVAQSDNPADLAWLQAFLGPAFEKSSVMGEQTFALERSPEAVRSAQRLESTTAERVAAFVLDTGLEELPGTTNAAGAITAYDSFFEVAYRRGTIISIADAESSTANRRARGALMRAIREAAMDHVWCDGASILHGASFAVGNRAILVAGAKEAGKTSLLCAALLGFPEASFLSNDRLVLQKSGKNVRAHALPTIVSIRAGSTQVVPSLSAALSGARENYLGAPTPESEKPDRWTLSPKQLSSLLGCSMQREAEVACCLFPRIDQGENSFTLRELTANERRVRILESAFARNDLGRRSELFRTNAVDFPSGAQLRERLQEDLGGIRCFEVRMGPGLYQAAEMNRLADLLLS